MHPRGKHMNIEFVEEKAIALGSCRVMEPKVTAWPNVISGSPINAKKVYNGAAQGSSKGLCVMKNGIISFELLSIGD